MPVKGGQAALPFMNRSTAMAFILPLLLFNFLSSSCSGLSDSEILLKFKDSLSNASNLDNWSTNDFPCNGNVANWKGVICVNDHVWGLRLERMGFDGKLDFQILEGMSDLKSLSFMHNHFEGPLPKINKLTTLRSLFLSNNHFSGEIPDDAFSGMSKLTKVFLGQNEFSGPIPSSLASIHKLMGVGLEDNKFTGEIPNFTRAFLTSFNVSNNQLEGEIPPALSKLGFTSFSGNKHLCGPPLSPCQTRTPTTATTSTSNTNTSPSNNNGSSDTKATGSPSLASVIVVIIVAIVALAAIILAAFILASRRGQRPPISLENPPPTNLQFKTCFKNPENVQHKSSDQACIMSKKAEVPKLSFVRDDRERFDLPDLLKASAEILGSGCFGSSYKAALSVGPTMVVKRFKQMNNFGKEEFHEHMRRLGRLRHPNVLPLVAYYYRKEEKLLVSDFVHYGSLSNLLHGQQSKSQMKLNWTTRMNIVKGIGKGLSYLYKELPSIIAAHGHLKSSNVLLNENFDPILADYGLVPVINQENAHELMVAYKSPEYRQLGRITRKTDVWSFGILIIELLTSKFPSIFLPKGNRSNEEEEDLANWVKSIPEDQWLDEVIDKEIRATKHCENEMIKLLKIGLNCCEEDVEKRLDLKQVVENIDEIQEKDEDNDFESLYVSEHGDKMSSREKSDDSHMIP